jgi:hypothetical protein
MEASAGSPLGLPRDVVVRRYTRHMSHDLIHSAPMATERILQPTIKYTNSGAVTVAYRVVGDTALDLLYIPGWFFNPEVWGNFVPIRRYLERLTSFARVVSVEKRGFGMSDRLLPLNLPTVEERVADISAVAESVGGQDGSAPIPP